MKKTNKRLLAAGGIFCAVGILFFGIGVASGGRNYVKTADLNRISGAAMMDSSDSHAILSKTEINAFSSLNIDLKNIDLDIQSSDDDNFYISYNIETNDGMLPLSYQVQNNALNIVEKKGHESYSYIHIDINSIASSSIFDVEIGSSADVGSSIRSTSGSTASALAMQSLCCCPPDIPSALFFNLSLTSSQIAASRRDFSTISSSFALDLMPCVLGP